MRMRHGKLEGEYIFKNGKYFFRAPKRARDYLGLDHPRMTTQTKRKIRRGNHHKANYPNEAFRLHNEMKMLAKLKHKVDPEVQDLLPEAVELAKQKKAERLKQSTLNAPQTNKYGSGLFNESNKGYADPNITTAKLTNTTQTNSLLQTEEEKNLGKILIGNARRMTNLCLWD
jgi:hypothetical protein